MLLQKLNKIGIRGTANDYLRSYLSHRRQYTAFKANNSELVLVTCGVPQGSCLGPILFNIYANDLTYLFDLNVVISYADDTAIVYSHSSLYALLQQLNNNMKRLYDWCKCFNLALNASKSHFMIFSRKQFDNCPPLIFNQEVITRVTCVKYLGFTLESNLKHYQHIRNLNSKLAQLTDVTNRHLSLDTAKIFYHSMINSHITLLYLHLYRALKIR